MERLSKLKEEKPRNFTIRYPDKLYQEVQSLAESRGSSAREVSVSFLRLKLEIDKAKFNKLEAGEYVKVSVGENLVDPDLALTRYSGTRSVQRMFKIVPDLDRQLTDTSLKLDLKKSSYIRKALALGLEIARLNAEVYPDDHRYGLKVAIGERNHFFIV